MLGRMDTKNLKYVLPFLFGLLWFFILEKAIPVADFIIYSPVDRHIPFNKWFVIPYIAWYPYIFITCVYFYFKSPYDFKKLMAFLAVGMFIACAIFTIYPNGQNLRPFIKPTDILNDIVLSIYKSDTPTNSLPSLHVIYSMGVHTALLKSRKPINNTVLSLSLVLMALISISTVFVKQHSIVDVFAGIAVSAVIYIIVYEREAIASALGGRQRRFA